MQFNIVTVFFMVLIAIASVHGGYDGAVNFFYPGAQQGVGGGGSSDVGPIQFPSAPLSAETSGVVPGASGYGFVQPQSRGFRSSQYNNF